MKINLLYRNSFWSIILLFLSVSSYGQINYSKSLEVYLDPKIISENQIRSLIVYAELSERSILDGIIYPGKLLEFEFDSSGFQTYLLSPLGLTSGSFITYGRGSCIQLNRYDQNHNLTFRYYENYIRSSEDLYEYDANNRKTKQVSIFEIDTVIQAGFEWEKNKLIKVRNLNKNETDKNRISIYDEKGRVTEVVNGTVLRKYQYTQNDDTLKTLITTFSSDTLVYTEQFNTLIKFNRITSYSKRDHSEKPIIEMNAQIDKNGNATYYYLNEFSENHYDDEKTPATIYNIRNIYNEKNLLIKRMYFSSKEDLGNSSLIKIERYFYDTDVLPFKFTMGSIIVHDEVDTE